MLSTVNWKITCSSKMCFTHLTMYSVSDSVSACTLVEQNSLPQLANSGTWASCCAYIGAPSGLACSISSMSSASPVKAFLSLSPGRFLSTLDTTVASKGNSVGPFRYAFKLSSRFATGKGRPPTVMERARFSASPSLSLSASRKNVARSRTSSSLS